MNLSYVRVLCCICFQGAGLIAPIITSYEENATPKKHPINMHGFCMLCRMYTLIAAAGCNA